MTQFATAPDVRRIAEHIIDTVPEHKRLKDVRVEYVFRDKAQKSKGRVVLGTAQKLTGLSAFLADDEQSAELADADPFFVVVIAYDVWERLDEKMRRALVDHELCHCTVEYDDEGAPKLATKGHDLEEFAQIIERHGLWSSNVAQFGSVVAEQLALAVEEVSEFLEDLGNNPPPADG